MKKIMGTMRRIGALIRRHIGLILRVVLWAMLIGLAILSAVARHEWWRGTTRVGLAVAVVAFLVVNVLIDIATKRARRPGKMGWLLVAAEVGVLCTNTYYHFGWAPAVAIGYLLWRVIPWPTPLTPPTPTPTPTPTQAYLTAAQAAAQAEAAALAEGASPAAAAAAAAAAANAAASTPAPAPSRSPSHGTEIGRWYFGTIPVIRLPLLTVRYSLGQGVVYRQVFGRLRDTEVFGNIKNWDITPDDVTARVTGTCTFRILPDKIGEKALEVWTGMPINFALDLDEALTRAKAK